MKIVLFVNSAKTFFWHRKALADRLVKEGHDVYVICSNDGDVKKFANQPYKTILVNLSRKGKNPFSEVALLVKLYFLFRKIQPDVCHNFTVKCVIFGSFAQKLAGVPKIINSITGLGIVFVKGGWLQTLVEKLYKFSLGISKSRVIFQNEDDRKLFIEKKIVAPVRATLIASSGVDVDKFKPLEKYPIITIIFASRLLKSKGVLFLLEASTKLHREGYVHNLLIAGESDTMSSDSINEKEIQQYKSQSHIEFLGNIENIHDLINASHIACFPSYYREGVPKFLIESAAAGLAIVTTDMPGCRDVVKGNGTTIPPQDSEALFCALSDLLKNPTKISELGLRSREIAIEFYSEKKVLTEIIGLYR